MLRSGHRQEFNMPATSTTITVDSLPVANSVDRTQDRLLIYTASATDIQGIAPNTMLGISGVPVGTTDSQTLSTKVLDNTNSLTIKDTNLVLQDDGDTTKQVKFQLSGLTTSTTRTLTIPDVSDTLVGLTATQTLTNKTLTAPVISGGSADNIALTVDTISGHTTSNTGTIYGVGITLGIFTGTSIITPQNLLSGTGSSWVWQAWTPTVTAGSGSFTTATGAGRYIQIGKSVFFQVSLTVTTVGSGTGAVFTLPVTAQSSSALTGTAREDVTSGNAGVVKLTSSTTGSVLRYDNGNITSGGSGSIVRAYGIYEAA